MQRHGGSVFVHRLAVMLAGLILSTCVWAQEMPKEYQDVLAYLGRKGDYKDNVLKVNIPRNDLHMTVAGISTPTPFGFGGWCAFTKGDGNMCVMMGDLVLLQDEVNPVMSALLEHGLEVTALHNHFFWDEPRVYYMHVHGHGPAQELARMVKPALDLIGHISPTQSTTSAAVEAHATVQQKETTINTASLNAIVGRTGESLGPVYKFTIGRDDLHISEMGAPITSRMGLNSWAAFVGSDEKAAVAGDIAMLEPELEPVLKALRKHDLDVVAIHHHMTGTHPTIIFLHYWGVGPAQKLAEGFKAAVDELGRSQAQAGQNHNGGDMAH